MMYATFNPFKVEKWDKISEINKIIFTKLQLYASIPHRLKADGLYVYLLLI